MPVWWDEDAPLISSVPTPAAPVDTLLDPRLVVGDLGCGTGPVAAALAPFVGRVIAVDRSGEMLQTARRRLREHTNVEVRRGELESLPISDGELDAATLVLVLHHLADPAEALREAGRTLKAGGRLMLCDMLPHDREEYRQQMGHVWLGFSDEQVRGLLSDAGFVGIRITPLRTITEAKGPALFVASGIRG